MQGNYIGYKEYDIDSIKVEDVLEAVRRKMSIGQKKVSIILCAWNELSYLYNCIEGIKKKTKNVDYEIIVIDNGSNPQVPKSSDYVLLRNEKNFGFGFSNNYGARYSIGEYVLFLNTDTYPINKNWLKNMISLYESRSDIGIVGAKLLFENNTIQHAGVKVRGKNSRDLSSIHLYHRYNKYDENVCYDRQVESITGACMLIRRDIFFKALCFDTQYKLAYCEDVDLCLKINELGYKVFYCSDAELYHYVSRTARNIDNVTRMKINKHNKTLLRRRWNLK